MGIPSLSLRGPGFPQRRGVFNTMKRATHKLCASNSFDSNDLAPTRFEAQIGTYLGGAPQTTRRVSRERPPANRNTVLEQGSPDYELRYPSGISKRFSFTVTPDETRTREYQGRILKPFPREQLKLRLIH